LLVFVVVVVVVVAVVLAVVIAVVIVVLLASCYYRVDEVTRSSLEPFDQQNFTLLTVPLKLILFRKECKDRMPINNSLQKRTCFL